MGPVGYLWTMAGDSSTKAALAAEVWQRMFAFLIDTEPHRSPVLGRHGLTPNDSRALFALDVAGGRTMGSLAEAWGCDASNATWVVDRLEKKGLAERRSLAGDRRVRLVGLTPLGIKTKAALSRDLDRPPPELLGLDRADLEALRSATRKLPQRRR